MASKPLFLFLIFLISIALLTFCWLSPDLDLWRIMSFDSCSTDQGKASVQHTQLIGKRIKKERNARVLKISIKSDFHLTLTLNIFGSIIYVYFLEYKYLHLQIYIVCNVGFVLRKIYISTPTYFLTSNTWIFNLP